MITIMTGRPGHVCAELASPSWMTPKVIPVSCIKIITVSLPMLLLRPGWSIRGGYGAAGLKTEIRTSSLTKPITTTSPPGAFFWEECPHRNNNDGTFIDRN